MGYQLNWLNIGLMAIKTRHNYPLTLTVYTTVSSLGLSIVYDIKFTLSSRHFGGRGLMWPWKNVSGLLH